MDTENVILLLAAVVAFTEFVKRLAPRFNLAVSGWQVQIVSALVAVGAVFLVAESAWGGQEFIFSQPLSALGGWDKLLVGLLLGLGSNFTDRIIASVASIGANTEVPR